MKYNVFASYAFLSALLVWHPADCAGRRQKTDKLQAFSTLCHFILAIGLASGRLREA